MYPFSVICHPCQELRLQLRRQLLLQRGLRRQWEELQRLQIPKVPVEQRAELVLLLLVRNEQICERLWSFRQRHVSQLWQLRPWERTHWLLWQQSRDLQKLHKRVSWYAFRTRRKGERGGKEGGEMIFHSATRPSFTTHTRSLALSPSPSPSFVPTASTSWDQTSTRAKHVEAVMPASTV